MRKLLYILVGALLLISTATASAQTDALVVAESGNVGVGTAIMAPNESLEITAALAPPFVDVPQMCQRAIPVRIVVTDTETADLLYSDQGLIDETSRLLTATLLPSDINGSKVQVGVLTTRRRYACIVIDISAVSETGVRRLVPDLVVK